MGARNFFLSHGMATVCGQTYPGTFAIARKDSFLAEQVANRDSASWKKAEHIVVEESQTDAGQSILSGWKTLTAADPIGRSIQKLYVSIGDGIYAMYNAGGELLGTGTLHTLFSLE